MRSTAHRLLFSQSFNATTSDINFGAPASELLTTGSQTYLALIYPTGSGEGTTGYICARTQSAGTAGMRFTVNHNSGNPQITFGLHSTISGAPALTGGANTVVYNAWNWVAASSTGQTVNSSGLRLYSSVGYEPIVDIGGTGANGGTALQSNSGNNFHIGNREGTDRTFNGQIAFVARWERVLSVYELRHAQKYGPMSIPGLTFLWANGRDYGPKRLDGTSANVTRSYRLPRSTALCPATNRAWLADVVAGGAFKAAWARNRNVVISPGGVR